MATSRSAEPDGRLDSWKEIAAYLRRSERTVRRWERCGGLPVHRLLHQKRSSIHAFKAELDAWWQSQGGDLEEAPKTAGSPAGARRLMPAIGIAALLLAAAALALLFRAGRSSAPEPGLFLRQLTFHAGSTSFPAVSHDGNWLAYASDRAERGGDFELWLQPLRGGEPIRLTRHPATDRQPDFSPDGSAIAFRSDRDGGGVYVVPLTGGPARRIADGGYNPRYSPDGGWVAYGGPQSRIYVVPAAGGQPHPVAPDFEILAGSPLWTPDGRRLLFMGAPVRAARAPSEYDWWSAPLDAGPVIRTEASRALQAQGLGAVSRQVFPSELAGDTLIFSAASGDATNLWRIRIETQSWKVTGPARQVTFSEGINLHARALAGQRLVFAAEHRITHVWGFPFDSNRGSITGPPEQWTRDASLVPGGFGATPRLSADGRKLVYASRRTGRLDVWVKDLEAGTELSLASTPWPHDRPLISPDGARIAYMTRTPTGSTISVAGPDGKASRVCADCEDLMDWSADGRWMLYGAGHPERILLLDLARGRSSEFAAHPREHLRHATFSPDGRWVAWVAGGMRLVVAPFGPGARPESEWIMVAPDAENSSPQWSPDGRLLYFFSERDGYRCLWLQRLAPSTKRLLGAASAVQHFHSMQRYPWLGASFSVARGRMAIALTEVSGNIWMLQPKPAR